MQCRKVLSVLIIRCRNCIPELILEQNLSANSSGHAADEQRGKTCLVARQLDLEDMRVTLQVREQR